MLYWDNAATSWPKPAAVGAAMAQSLREYGGNPGRAGHAMSLAAAESIYICRQETATFFGLPDPTGVVFTHNCTAALNTVIRGVVGAYGRVLISDLEHNAVWRPSWGLDPHRPRVDIAAWSMDEEETVENFRRRIRADTKLIVCTHASNVFGVTFPIRRLAALAKEYGILFCVDAAQSAGVLPIDMQADGIDYLCVAAHKGLYAPMGMGMLLCRDGTKLTPLVRGGTGSYSRFPDQPEEMPDHLESGTPNTVGICGTLAGLRFVRQRGRETIYRHELQLVGRLYDRLSACRRIRLYTPRPQENKAAPLLSVNVEGHTGEEVAALLNEKGVAVRAGLHCAPLAHRRFGTLPSGTVRLAPSAFSTAAEVDKICNLFYKIAQK